MYSIDPNILIFSVVKDAPQYKKSREFLIKKLNETEPIFLCWETLYAFIRITTSKRSMRNPLPFGEAVHLAQLLKDRQNVTMLQSSSESFRIFRNYQETMALEGNLISDAIISSQLEANGIRKIYTNDRDFWKFPELRPVDPLSG